MIYIYFMNKIVFILNIPKQKGRTIKVKAGKKLMPWGKFFFFHFYYNAVCGRIEVHSNRNNTL